MRNRILNKTIILSVLFLFAFSIPANAADYKKAYRKTIEKSKYADWAKYSLVYIDNDKIPELVCYLGAGGGISIYSYKSGKVKCLTNKYISKEVEGSGAGFPYWKEGSGGFGTSFYYYIPKKNKLCHIRGHKQWNKYGFTYKYVYTFFKIKKARFEIKKLITFDEKKQIPKDYKDLSGKYAYREILRKLR